MRLKEGSSLGGIGLHMAQIEDTPAGTGFWANEVGNNLETANFDNNYLKVGQNVNKN